jgi:hypothetical protein
VLPRAATLSISSGSGRQALTSEKLQNYKGMSQEFQARGITRGALS